MQKATPYRGKDASFGRDCFDAVGETLRVLQQVDSDLHLARLERHGNELQELLARRGLSESARIARAMAAVASCHLRARTALARGELRTLHKDYIRLAGNLESRSRTAPSTKYPWARWKARRGEQP